MPESQAYKGFWLQRDSKLLPSQMGKVSGNVEVIRSLDELTVDSLGWLYIGDRAQMRSRPSLRYRRESTQDWATTNPFFAENAVYMPSGIAAVTERFTEGSFWGVPIREFVSAA